MITNEFNKPLVSIVINCYNGEKYLKETLDSVLSQTYSNWEVIFWDNQSTDRSAQICKSYSDDRIKYFYARVHTTLGQARNLAINCTKGDWLSFLDCDDMWVPDKLEQQTDIILDSHNPNLGLIYGHIFELNSDKNLSLDQIEIKEVSTSALLPTGQIFNKMLIKNFVPIMSAIIRRDLFFKVGGINSSLTFAEDYDLFLKITRVSEAKSINKVIAIYRLHGENMIFKKAKTGIEECIELLREYSKYPEAKIGLKRKQLEMALAINNHSGLSAAIKYAHDNKILISLYLSKFLSPLMRTKNYLKRISR